MHSVVSGLDPTRVVGIERARACSNGRPIGIVTHEQLLCQIAETKLPDLNDATAEGAMKTVEGTPRGAWA
jgi:ribosomal protein L11